MKKSFIHIFLSTLIVSCILSCGKEEIDPTLPPIIESTSNLDAEDKVNLLISEGKNIEFLIDLQDDDIWKACTNTTYDAVYAYGVGARIILDIKQKKVEKKSRNVVTVYSIRYKVFADSDYLANIYNNQKIRFYKATTSSAVKSPRCTTLNYFFSSAQSYGGVLVK